MKTVLIFNLNDGIDLPQDFIDSVPSSGPADESVSDLRLAYDVQCSESDLVQFLKSYGAWEAEELTDHDENINRLIWLSCLDCQESSSTYFYMGS